MFTIPIASTGSDIVNLVTGLAWPVIVGILLVLLMPSIRKVIASRGFTVKAGGMEITVQQASEQLSTGLDDLRNRLIDLEGGGGPDGTGGAASREGPTGSEPQPSDATAGSSEGTAGPAVATNDHAATSGLTRLGRLLWVDDFPANNAFEVDALQRKNVQVMQALSSAEALSAIDESGPFDAVITDLGRQDEGPDAGLNLLRELRKRNINTPVIIYASAPAVARAREQAAQLGAYGITASATELMTLLARLGLS